MPVPPMLIAQAASLVPSLVQGFTGMEQSRRARKILDNLNRPQFEIPTAATEALGTARTLASTNQLPNQVQAEMGINQSTANALYNINQNATSGTEALAAITGVAANENAAMNDLSGRAAVFSQQQNQNLMNQLNQYAGWQNRAWDYNVNQPFQMKLAEGQALAAAGMQNKYEALKGGAGATANIFGNKALMENGTGGADKWQDNYFNPVKPIQQRDNMMLDAPSTNMEISLDTQGALVKQLQAIAALERDKGFGNIKNKTMFYNPE